MHRRNLTRDDVKSLLAIPQSDYNNHKQQLKIIIDEVDIKSSNSTPPVPKFNSVIVGTYKHIRAVSEITGIKKIHCDNLVKIIDDLQLQIIKHEDMNKNYIRVYDELQCIINEVEEKTWDILDREFQLEKRENAIAMREKKQRWLRK